ncbi:MAG TPA: hypothetical protein VND64_15500 [Pirellulales bacterium]|nr:hypothetical protein [Pirellulales bacterium]
MTSKVFDYSREPALLGFALAALAAYGCGDRSGVGSTHAVSGKVTLDGQPLSVKTTVILFKPDAAKGNKTPFSPAGGVDQEGTYRLSTQGKKGAPPGWYRVIVTAHEGAVEHPKQAQGGADGARSRRPTARAVVPAKYGREESSDLLIEVVENPAPGAYDLRLTNQ